MSNVMQFPRRDIAYRYGLLLAAGTEGEMREDRIREGIRYAERRAETSLDPWTEDDLREMIESKRERLLWQLEDLDKML